MPREHERTTYLTETIIEASSGRHPARISDISTGGCYIDSIVEVTVGDPISFEINRSGDESLQFSGTVAYRLSGMGFGVKYAQLNAAQDRFLRGLS